METKAAAINRLNEGRVYRFACDALIGVSQFATRCREFNPNLKYGGAEHDLFMFTVDTVTLPIVKSAYLLPPPRA